MPASSPKNASESADHDQTRRDDERPGVPLAQWRAPARDEDPELRTSANFLRAALETAWRGK